MPLWGANTGSEAKPKWLTEEEKANTYATSQGWVFKRADGTEELLVAVGDLATTLANADITAVYFANTISSYSQGATKSVIVVYNEPVSVPNSAPTLLVQGTNVNATATYASGNNTNKLVFNFTVPSNTQTMFIRGQTITTNSTVSIVDVSNTAVNSAVVFANSIVVGVQAKAGASANVAVA